MTKTLTTYAEQLKTALDNDDRILALVKAEKIMELNSDFKLLQKTYGQAQQYLSQIMENHANNETLISKARKYLQECKYNLDTAEVVLEYNRVYRVVNELYCHISDELFSQFRSELLCRPH